MCCPEGQRIAEMIADMVGDALAQGGSTSYGRYLFECDRFRFV
jgi:hypothetical protein